MPRGGKRPGAGRRRVKISGDVPDKSFAARVLSRIGELGLPNVKDMEDYALHLLQYGDVRIRKEIFTDLVNRTYGRAPLAVNLDNGVEGGGGGSVKVSVEFIGEAS